jgi:hypothetical protein
VWNFFDLIDGWLIICKDKENWANMVPQIKIFSDVNLDMPAKTNPHYYHHHTHIFVMDLMKLSIKSLWGL